MDTFPIYSPTSHHAIELVPIGMDVKVRFTKCESLQIDPKELNQLFPPAQWLDGMFN